MIKGRALKSTCIATVICSLCTESVGETDEPSGRLGATLEEEQIVIAIFRLLIASNIDFPLDYIVGINCKRSERVSQPRKMNFLNTVASILVFLAGKLA
jgi:hypothetical protein